ncbi:MAG: FHA domain-containing protein [Fimbriimonadaceae bacterium]|nr:FHA domain-containing protein [Fimbriimonadaceae bacterium]
MGSIFLKVFVGAVAGLVCWAIFEPMAPKTFSAITEASWGNWERMFTIGLGAIVGLAIGGVNGILQGGKVHATRGALLGLLFGAIGSSLGYALGGTLATLSHMPIQTVLWRILALTPIGAFLGLAIGASTLNGRRAVQGLIGGSIGGAVGGALFDIIGTTLGQFLLALKGVQAGMSGEIGGPSRAIYAILMAAAIALFIGLVERFARSAWVRLSLGRNEGKEWVLDASQNFIGRSERANIPLFGDPNVAPMHACIVRQGPGQFLLADGGSPTGTLLNGQRIQQAPLAHGSTITVGSFNLTFLLKSQPAPVRGPEAYPGQAYPIGGPPGYGASSTGQPNLQQGYPPAPVAGYGQSAQQVPMQPTMQVTPMAPQAPVGGGVTLTAMDGPLMGQRFPVTSTLDVGREQPAIPLSFDSQVSRRHATLTPDLMGLTLTDLNSTNGTFVNGQRVQSQIVRSGDLVKIGATTFRVD